MTEETEVEREHRVQHIRNLYAFDLFCQHRFDDSLKIFAELGTGVISFGYFCCQILLSNSLKGNIYIIFIELIYIEFQVLPKTNFSIVLSLPVKLTGE